MKQSLAVAQGVVKTVKLNEQRIENDIEKGFLDATALAEYLTGKGVPFRQAHHIVGELVASAEHKGLALAQLPIATLKEASGAIGSDVYESLGAVKVVRAYKPPGAGGMEQLSDQIDYWSERLSN